MVQVQRVRNHMRPEHQYYDEVEEHFLRSILEGQDFLSDCDRFEVELRRLWVLYDFPYQVGLARILLV